MAQAPQTYAYTFTTGSISLADLMGVRQKTWILSIAVRADRSNSNDVTWHVENMGTGGYIGPGEAVVFDFAPDGTLVGTLSFQGQVNDKMYLTIGLSTEYTNTKGLT